MIHSPSNMILAHRRPDLNRYTGRGCVCHSVNGHRNAIVVRGDLLRKNFPRRNSKSKIFGSRAGSKVVNESFVGHPESSLGDETKKACVLFDDGGCSSALEWSVIASHRPPTRLIIQCIESIDYLRRECGDISTNNQQKGGVNFIVLKRDYTT
jgi:hypothetical protein